MITLEHRRIRASAPVLSLLALVAVGLIGASSPAGASCPSGTVGRFKSEFDGAIFNQSFGWILPASADFQSGGKATVDFALLPFNEPGGITSIHLEDSDTFASVRVYFNADGSTKQGEDAGPDYARNKWNNVKIKANFDDQTFELIINGVGMGPHAFIESSDGLSKVTFLYSGPGAEEDIDIGYADNIKVTKATSEGPSVLATERFNDNSPPDPGIGEIKNVASPTNKAGTGANCPTTTTLEIDKSGSSVTGKGQVLPKHPGEQVLVKLFEKKPSGLSLVAKKTSGLNANSRYSATFDRPNRQTCKMT
ncbi:MAG TPA: hypothetical protein VEV82_10605, partial [Actinomycetota bacterium]|nr:hypothetical protein [Actinomycetota bacterium]